MKIQQKYLTIEQKNEKERELKHLKNVLIPENADEIEDAKSQGDLSENAEYDAAKDVQAKLHQKKKIIEDLLNHATIIKENLSNETVEIGHSIELKWSDGKTETIKLLGYGNGKENISIEAPLGKALLGKRPKDIVSIEAPVGRLSLEVLSIK
jgi:transcription elongation factor GreA